MQVIEFKNNTANKDSKKNSRFIFALFCITIIFQLTGLKYIWSLESVARIANLLVLILLIIYAFRAVGAEYYSKDVWYYYLVPGIFVFCGMFLNISLNVVSNFKLISIYGLTLPWLTYLIMPSLLKLEVINTATLWKYYYYFVLWANLLGILDYVLMSYGLSNLRILETPNGIFLGGNFSLLHMLEDETPHYRYYSCFMEPGTLAMYLLPAISYAFFHKKYIGLVVFLLAFFLTDSLGGLASLLMLTAIISFLVFNRKKNYFLFAIVTIFTIASLLWFNFGELLINRYEDKKLSASVREDNVTNTITNLPALVINFPLGMKLAEETAGFEKNKIYVGSNFAPATYLQYGGIISFVGYLACLIVSLFVSFKSILRADLVLEEKIVFSSIFVLFPFIFQRTTIWESALFAFLFAPTIIKGISKN